jgi:hypothetical protein
MRHFGGKCVQTSYLGPAKLKYAPQIFWGLPDFASKEAISASLTFLHRLNDPPSGSTGLERRAQQALEFREKHSIEGPFL